MRKQDSMKTTTARDVERKRDRERWTDRDLGASVSGLLNAVMPSSSNSVPPNRPLVQIPEASVTSVEKM